MHKIDLQKYEVRTDMAIDLLKSDNNSIPKEEITKGNVKISWIKLEENNSIGKKKGNYLTIEFDDITDTDAKNKVSLIFKEELKKMLERVGINKDSKTLVVGLGNINSTPDSLGPLVSNKIIVTKHLFDMDEKVDDNFSSVSSIYPGVTGQTGIETSDLIKAVRKETTPDLIIVIDSLASSTISRVNKCIQVTDSGITPGSGIGNKRKEISKETLGIPVIAIGVPTVTSAAVIVSDTINYMLRNYAYSKKINKSKISKLISKPINFLNKDVDLNNEDKKTLLGLIGTLSEEELLNLTYEVLTPIGYNLMVTPKEVDFIIEKLSEIISFGINHSLHKI